MAITAASALGAALAASAMWAASIANGAARFAAYAVARFIAQTPPEADSFVRTLMGLLATYLGLVLVLLALWAWLVVRMIRRMTVHLSETDLLALRSVSIALPLSIDAVDFGLDFLGAPLTWFIANQTALKPLRGASLFEGLVPGTQLIPTMTIGWYWANHVRRDGPWPAGHVLPGPDDDATAGPLTAAR